MSTNLPGCDASSFSQHWLQLLQQNTEHKDWLTPHHLLSKVGDVLRVQLACFPATTPSHFKGVHSTLTMARAGP